MSAYDLNKGKACRAPLSPPPHVFLLVRHEEEEEKEEEKEEEEGGGGERSEVPITDIALIPCKRDDKGLLILDKDKVPHGFEAVERDLNPGQSVNEGRVR